MLGFDSEPALAGLCASVIHGAGVVLRLVPEGFQPSGLFHAVKSRKERPGSHDERVLGYLLDTPSNAQA
jgi:hypothetical protein